ncbi:MAG: hypothetical protein CM15mV61_330 [uncultured marine virus]|nr:MAG: hypothetical protein CM15mV61_330 [uncultured marine virus]
MPEENKIKKDDPQVDIDTSGPDVDVNLPEEKQEETGGIADIQVDEKTTEQETDKTFENERETKLEEGGEVEKKEEKEDDKLEEYSKGVQSRIAKLTRKMREAERREKAALDYAKAVEEKRKTTETKFSKVNEDYVKQFENRVKDGLDAAQKSLAIAIENSDAAAQIEAQKKIAALSIDEARLNALKEQQTINKEVSAPKLSDANTLPESTPQSLPTPDPKAEDWASKNSWFGKDRAMTFTAFEIHKDLVEREGFDPQTDEYYAEVDKRIRVEFPHKFDTKETQTSKPTQNVASVKRSAVRQGKQTVRLTSSQVAIAKKLGVPLEEYAKQIKITEGA